MCFCLPVSHVKIRDMKTLGDLHAMETFMMALADKTRLRLLNLMAEDEICVCFFTEVLGESQPKISRHLAYLRNADVVSARRDGKWVHYSIKWPGSTGLRSILRSTLSAAAAEEQMQADQIRYKEVIDSPELLGKLAKTPIDLVVYAKPHMAVDIVEEPMPKRMPSHNELDEFLL